MQNYFSKIKALLVVVIMAAALPAIADQADLDTEKTEYIKAFTSNNLDAIKAKARTLELTGHTDVAIFDPLEQKVLAHMGANNKADLDAAAWMIRGLASSGNTKYLPTFNKVLEGGHKKLQRHAKNAIQDLAEFASANAIVSAGLDKAPSGRLNHQRTLNMMASSNNVIVRDGVRRAYKDYSRGSMHDKQVMDQLNTMLLAGYKNERLDKNQLDALVVACKSLANTGNQDYAATINEVANNAPNKKLRAHATKIASKM
jgi:hypothetical protein